MPTQDVICNLESAINKICEDIKNKRGSTGKDKLDMLSKLVNSYSRLLEREQTLRRLNSEYGDPTHIASIEQRQPYRGIR